MRYGILFLAVFYIGCTAIGYVAGDSIDEHNARSKSVTLTADSCDCDAGDRIKLFLVSGDSLNGCVKEVKSGEYLRVMTRFPDPIAHDSGKVEEIPWADIRSVEVIKKSVGWRVALTTVGVLADATIYIAIMTLRSFSGSWST